MENAEMKKGGSFAHGPEGSPWSKSFFLHALFLASFVVLYFPVFKSLVTAWGSSDEYSHGFFILPISIYIVWQKRKALAGIPIRSSWWGLILVLMGLVAYGISLLAGIVTAASFSLVFTIGAVVIFLYGLQMFKMLLFPLFFLLFMIPVPAQIYASATIPLQLLVSKISVWIAYMMNIPVYREGNIIHLPERTLQVVQACSGLRSIISLLTLSAIFGYLTLRSNLLRSFLFLSGIPVAILVNIFRVLIIILAFYYFDYDLTFGEVHTVFGLILFVVGLLLIYLIKGVLAVWDKSAQAS